MPDQTPHPASPDDRRPRGRRRPAQRDPLAGVLGRLDADVAATPDVTDRVMQRLGYARCTPAEARHAAFVRAGRRIASVAVVLVVFGIGVAALDMSRREATRSTALEQRLRDSLRERGQWLNDVVDGLQPVSTLRERLAPRHEPESAGDSVDPDKAAIAPFRQA